MCNTTIYIWLKHVNDITQKVRTMCALARNQLPSEIIWEQYSNFVFLISFLLIKNLINLIVIWQFTSIFAKPWNNFYFSFNQFKHALSWIVKNDIQCYILRSWKSIVIWLAKACICLINHSFKNLCKSLNLVKGLFVLRYNVQSYIIDNILKLQFVTEVGPWPKIGYKVQKWRPLKIIINLQLQKQCPIKWIRWLIHFNDI